MFYNIEELSFMGSQLINFHNIAYLILRLGINLFFTLIIIRFIFYPVYRDRDYLFTNFIINISVFLICFMLGNIQLKIGFAFGLFAVLSIIRYRTEQIQIRYMTYTFAVIIIAVLNALSDKDTSSFAELLLVNFTILSAVYLLEKNFFHPKEILKVINYEKIELIKPEKYDLLINDLKERTGLNIKKAEIESINFLNDTAKLKILFLAPEAVDNKNKLKNIFPLAAFSIFIFIQFFLIHPLKIQAQSMENENTQYKNINKPSKTNKLKLYFETELEYNDNIFKLTKSQISKMKTNDNEDITSGRFKYMKSVTDFIIEPSLHIKANLNNSKKSKTEFAFQIKYNYFTQNEEKNFPECKIKLNNSIGKKSVLKLAGNFSYNIFKKNYLSGANDINGNGNISRDERIYSPAKYDEGEGIILYEYSIIKNKNAGVSKFNIEPTFSYNYRKYNSVLKNRNQNIMLAGLGLNFELLSIFGFEIIYQYESVDAPNYTELILYNENTGGLDCNKHGKLKDNAALLTNIDRASDRHTIEIKPTIKITKDCLFYAAYKNRNTTYKTSNKLDIERYNQNEYLQEIKAGIKLNFFKQWAAQLEYNRSCEDEYCDGKYYQNNYIFKIRGNFI